MVFEKKFYYANIILINIGMSLIEIYQVYISRGQNLMAHELDEKLPVFISIYNLCFKFNSIRIMGSNIFALKINRRLGISIIVKKI